MRGTILLVCTVLEASGCHEEATGDFKIEVRGLKVGAAYQYRALVVHPKITRHDGHKQVKVR